MNKPTIDGLIHENSLGALARKEVGLKLFDYDLIGSGTHENLEHSTELRTQYRTAREMLETEHRSQLAELAQTITDVLLLSRPPSKSAHQPVIIRNARERVETLLNRDLISDDRARQLWGKPNPSLKDSKKTARESIPGDIATTLYWFREAMKGRGHFNMAHFSAEPVDIRGYIIPDVAQDTYSAAMPSSAPFAILYRVKSQASRNIKTLGRFAEAVQFVREVLREGPSHSKWPHLLTALNVGTIDAKTRRSLNEMERYWNPNLKKRIIESAEPFHTKVNDIGGVTVFYLGGHLPGANDSMARGLNQVLDHPFIQKNYTFPRGIRDDYQAPSARLHRFKLTLEPVTFFERSRIELVFVDIASHIREYEFGSNPHSQHRRRREQRIITPTNIDAKTYRRAYDDIVNYFKNSKL